MGLGPPLTLEAKKENNSVSISGLHTYAKETPSPLHLEVRFWMQLVVHASRLLIHIKAWKQTEECQGMALPLPPTP